MKTLLCSCSQECMSNMGFSPHTADRLSTYVLIIIRTGWTWTRFFFRSACLGFSTMHLNSANTTRRKHNTGVAISVLPLSVCLCRLCREHLDAGAHNQTSCLASRQRRVQSTTRLQSRLWWYMSRDNPDNLSAQQAMSAGRADRTGDHLHGMLSDN